MSSSPRPNVEARRKLNTSGHSVMEELYSEILNSETQSEAGSEGSEEGGPKTGWAKRMVSYWDKIKKARSSKLAMKDSSGPIDHLESFKTNTDAVFKMFNEISRKDPVQISGLPSLPKRLSGCLEAMCSALKEESDSISDPLSIGPCLQHLLNASVLDRLSDNCLPNKPSGSRLPFVRFLIGTIIHVQQPLLIHQAVLKPLERTLQICALNYSELSSEEHEAFVDLLFQLSIRIADDESLLPLFFHPAGTPSSSSSSSSKMPLATPLLTPTLFSNHHNSSKLQHDGNIQSSRQGSTGKGPSVSHEFLVLTSLIPYMHYKGRVGSRARDALLLCMLLSHSHPDVGLFVVEATNLCLTLSTGLSALYSELPSTLPATGKNPSWRVADTDINRHLPELVNFLASLDFCNSVVRIAHSAVCKSVLDFVYSGFLIPVVCPALHQHSPMELIAATCYVSVALRHITEASLLKPFLRLIVTSSYESHPGLLSSVRTLDALIQRINHHNNELTLATLNFFLILIDLNCEEVMYELCFRHLVPGTHVHPDMQSPLFLEGHFAKENLFNSAKAFLALSDGYVDSPGGLSFHNYLRDVRLGFAKTALGCRCWGNAYDRFIPPSEAPSPMNSVSSSPLLSSPPRLPRKSSVPHDSAHPQFHASGSNGDHPLNTTIQNSQHNSSLLTSSSSASSSSTNPAPGAAHNKSGFFSNLTNKLAAGKQKLALIPLPLLSSNRETLHLPPPETFLKVLLLKLECFLHNSLNVNLLLTSILIRLLYYPQPILRDFLLNPFLKLSSSEFVSLHNTLSSVSKEAAEAFSKHPDLRQHIDTLRNNVKPVAPSPPPAVNLNHSLHLDSTTMGQSFMNFSVLGKSMFGGSDSTILEQSTISAGPRSPNTVHKDISLDSGSFSQGTSFLQNISPKRLSLVGKNAMSSFASRLGSKNPREGPIEEVVEGENPDSDLTSQVSVPPATLNATTLSNDSKKSVSHATASGHDPESLSRDPPKIVVPEDAQHAKAKKRTALGVLVFEEFLKEIAACCLEHAVS